MIRVKIENKKIQIKGHALYDDFGKDIDCAGDSTLVITTVNAILRFDREAITYQVKEGNVLIEKKKDTKEVNLLLENMIALLKELEKKYKKNIKIEEVSSWD